MNLESVRIERDLNVDIQTGSESFKRKSPSDPHEFFARLYESENTSLPKVETKQDCENTENFAVSKSESVSCSSEDDEVSNLCVESIGANGDSTDRVGNSVNGGLWPCFDGNNSFSSGVDTKLLEGCLVTGHSWNSYSSQLASLQWNLLQQQWALRRPQVFPPALNNFCKCRF